MFDICWPKDSLSQQETCEMCWTQPQNLYIFLASVIKRKITASGDLEAAAAAAAVIIAFPSLYFIHPAVLEQGHVAVMRNHKV